MSDQNPWRLQSGPYLGEVSALCFLHAPHLSSFPFLLAGSGSQMLLYDLESGKVLNSFYVFKGIRVHGISCSFIESTNCRLSSTLAFKIAIFGERRVKLFSLHFDTTSGDKSQGRACSTNLTLIHLLPKFSHWVMDACFMKEDYSEFDGTTHLAVGLSDNSVCLWDICRSNVVLEVKCPERCLLYSMRLWGDNVKALRVASGTIHNEIIVWKLVPQELTLSSTSLVENKDNLYAARCIDIQLLCQQYKAVHISRLTGHEGSIFRIAWSSNGSKLISVSDDRSARIWTLSATRGNVLGESTDISVGLVLFGHNARVWDCYFSDSIIITAGEDCTCRVWGMDGKQLMMIKEHTGRGIWRCLYDPSSSLLITAGFDSAIKVHPLHASSFRDLTKHNGVVKEFECRTEIFTICTPNLSEQVGFMDSKSEYVRCLHFAREDILYVATNHGYLHHVKLSDPENVRWTELVHVSEEVPIICMDLLSTNTSNLFKDVDDWIAIGDGKGNVTVVRIINGASAPSMAVSFTWSAEIERQLLGAYWCKSLGYRHLFTADPKGRLKLWRLGDAVQSVADKSGTGLDASLIAEFTSCFGTRIMCLDGSFEEEVLVCGDQRGNLIVFPLSKGLFIDTSIAPEEKIPSLTYFKGAHGISAVASILIATLNFKQVEIRSTGGDGCICYFKYDEDPQSLEFMGMKQVKELSLIQSVSANSSFSGDLVQGNYAIGFASADFIIWNLINDVKILLVPCGGWRRPHSYFLGGVPEIQHCFAYLKDQTIHVNRLWVPASERRLLPQVLHMQYHGREIHSLCFISVALQLNPSVNSDLFSSLSWIATGCEDGTVRLTRYTPDGESWSASKLLGEHVGGSAVRSICFISEICAFPSDQTCTSYGRHGHTASSDNRDNQFLLISVGAKQVLTCWLLRYRRLDNKQEALGDGALSESENKCNPAKDFPSISFQWLSTHMPPKFASTRKRVENMEENIERKRNASIMNTAAKPELSSSKSWESPADKNENDWRYLAVTAFIVKGADCRLTVCFIVVACSDATLTLRALLLPCRLWFDVALLVPQTSPVLSLQHVVIPLHAPSKDMYQITSAYIIISGSTDGSITFWDLTETVKCFMQRVSMLQPQNLIDCQRRPRTGRGSQGGRWWRSVTTLSDGKDPSGTSATINTVEDINGHNINQVVCGSSSKLRSDPINSQTVCPEIMDTDNSTVEIDEVRPLHVLNSVHQSGANCLHVSNIMDSQHSRSELVYYLLSGGDDQALHSLGFDLALHPTDYDAGHRQPCDIMTHMMPERVGGTSGSEKERYKFRFLYRDRIASAHSSAIKGVWTDGTWVFSTGLDQRVRCWRLGECGKLTEYACLIISVPEPETLDARACGRNQYQIAVAGRGMQMVDFSPSCNDDCKD